MRDLEIHRKALNKLFRELRSIVPFPDDPDATDILLNPAVEGELPLGGYCFKGLTPPIVSNPVFAIRKKALLVFTITDYADKGSMPLEQQAVIESAILTRKHTTIANTQEISIFNWPITRPY